jgi:PleD family two-component response regulator
MRKGRKMLLTIQQDLEKSAGILVIDDCPEDRETYVRLLTPRRDGAPVFVAEDAEDALTILESRDIDCILVDYNLPDADGIDLVAAIRKCFNKKEVGIIVTSGIGSEQVVTEAFKAGADDYLPKSSITRAKIRCAVDEALLKARNRRTVDALSY